MPPAGPGVLGLGSAAGLLNQCLRVVQKGRSPFAKRVLGCAPREVQDTSCQGLGCPPIYNLPQDWGQGVEVER
jgi:hypothetical protein